MKSSINARLEDGYSVKELKQAIDNYNMVVKSEDYFFTYDNWSLNEFFTRAEGEQVEKFLENPEGFEKDNNNDDSESSATQFEQMGG